MDYAGPLPTPNTSSNDSSTAKLSRRKVHKEKLRRKNSKERHKTVKEMTNEINEFRKLQDKH